MNKPRQLIATIDDRYQINVWDLDKQRLLWSSSELEAFESNHRGSEVQLGFSNDSMRLFACVEQKRLEVFLVDSGQRVRSLLFEPPVVSFVTIGDSFITSHKDGLFRVWTPEYSEIVNTLETMCK
jgi:WD40 repeat protein